ncbi:hypothetical protein CYMTET_37716 [Cymbomonas tetramitiformis]|uniref:Uncharacterized protein n=1 Tax=Cymbomonas tetramitiformis TaxID=36881 RepID=A0AAE0CDH9_9CHLO|nr:hypothetical protein CYMTET_37716 [Cymbomonas tetramitiformis]
MEEFLRFVARDNPGFATGFVNEYYPQRAAFVTELMLADEQVPGTAKVPDVADPGMFWKGRWCSAYALPLVSMTQAAIEEDDFKVPAEKSLVILKSKKQRGRPKKPTSAWERQSSSDDSDN